MVSTLAEDNVNFRASWYQEIPTKLVLRRTKVGTAAGKSSHRGAQKYERMPTNQGETAGARDGFCRGSREFLPGKLELRGRCQIWQRPLPSLVAGAAKSVIGRCYPFFVFDYLQKADSRSLGKGSANRAKNQINQRFFEFFPRCSLPSTNVKGTKIIAEIQIFSQRLITEFFFRSVHHTNDLIEN